MSSQLRWGIIKQFTGKNTFGFRFHDVEREYVVTKKQIKQAIRNIGGIAYQFIQHDTTRFFGFDSIWINQLEKSMWILSVFRMKSFIEITEHTKTGDMESGNAFYAFFL